jgi:hypothetical protein
VVVVVVVVTLATIVIKCCVSIVAVDIVVVVVVLVVFLLLFLLLLLLNILQHAAAHCLESSSRLNPANLVVVLGDYDWTKVSFRCFPIPKRSSCSVAFQRKTTFISICKVRGEV